MDEDIQVSRYMTSNRVITLVSCLVVVGAFTLSLIVHNGEGVSSVTAVIVVIVSLCLIYATVYAWKACLIISPTYVESVGLMSRKRILYSEVENITKTFYPAVQSKRTTIWIFPAFERQPEILAFVKKQVKCVGGERIVVSKS